MKTIDKIVLFVIIFTLGAATYGFIGETVEIYSQRSEGNCGGEVLILPLMIALIAFGWELRGCLHKK